MVEVTARARQFALETRFEARASNAALRLPQQIAVFANGNTSSVYSEEKFQALRAVDVANRLGFGSPAHLAVRELLPDNGDGAGAIPVWVYPLANGTTAATGTITPSGTVTAQTTWKVRVNNIDSPEFVIPAAATVAARTLLIHNAISAVLEMPVTSVDASTVVNITSKWRGTSANSIFIEMVQVGTVTGGNLFTIVQPTGGAGDPTVTAALGRVGPQWITMGLNTLPTSNTTALDAFANWGEGRWGETVRKPAVIFAGTTEAVVATAISVPTARKATDRTNAQLVAPGSRNLPFVVAARQLARIARLANEDPAFDYGGRKATGITPGLDSQQWDTTARQTAFNGGSSTIEVNDGVVEISDVITFWAPTGEVDPAYRYVVDIVKLQNCIYNIDAEFMKPEWNGAPFIKNEDPTTNKNARKPRSVETRARKILDNLGMAAILTDVKTSKQLTRCTISTTNNKRWDLEIPVFLAGNSNVRAAVLRWGFGYGAPEQAA